MAKQTIQADIKVTGVPGAIAELKALGAAGEQTGKKIKAAFAPSDNGFSATLAAARTQFAAIGAVGSELRAKFRETSKVVNEVGTAFFEVGKRAAELALVVGGLEFGLGKLAKSAVEAVTNIERNAQALGITTEQFQRLQFAATAVGLGGDQLSAVLTKVNLAIEQFGSGAAKAADTGIKVFKDLGITVTDAMTASKARIDETKKAQDGLNISAAAGDVEMKNAADVLKSIGFVAKGDVHANLVELAKDFAKITDEQKRFALEAKLVGTRGSAVAFDALLRSLTELEPQFEKTGAAFTELDKEIGKEGELAFAKLETSVRGLKDKIGLALVPALSQFADGLTKLIADNLPAIQTFVRGLADQAIPLIKDFFNALSGNDAAVKNPAILQLRDNVVAFGKGVRETVVGLVAAFALLGAAVNVLVKPFNDVFGTHVTAGVIAVSLAVLNFLGILKLLAAIVPLVTLDFEGLLAVLTVPFTPAGLIAAGVGALLGLILAFWPQIVAAAQSAFTALVAAAQATWTAIVAGFHAVIDALTSGWTAISDAAIATWDAIAGAATALWDNLTAGFNAVVGVIEGAWNGLVGFIESAINTVSAAITSLISQIQAAITAAAQLANQAGADQSTLGQPMARGGAVFGPGSGTSDSILARLSNGEFVMRAAAVKHWGLEFMAALNHLRNPFRGFSLGGLVDGWAAGMSIPHFAGGGLAVAAAGGSVSGRPVHLSIGNQTFVLAGPEQTVANLAQAAAKERMLSIGQPPRKIAR